MDTEVRNRSSFTTEELETIFSNIRVYDFNGFKIRALEHSGQAWIVFADVCKALGYKNPNHEKKKIRPSEMCKLEIGLKNTLGTCVNRAGMVSFSLLSNKPEAESFRLWTDEQIFGKRISRELPESEIYRLIQKLSKNSKVALQIYLQYLSDQEREEVT